MPFDLQQLQQHNEADLRAHVLIPLFEAMGFMDIRDHHGSGELGKDIVMWKMGEVGVRKNFAAVVKADRITGQTTGSGRTVVMQVNQCFGSSYCDPVSGDAETVHECFVVSPHSIRSEARISIMAALTEPAKRGVSFIDGQKLLELLEEYYPQPRLLDRLRDVKRGLPALGPGRRLTATYTDDGVEFGLSSSEEPFVGQIRLVFPDTDEGHEGLAGLQDHLRTGAPVQIPAHFVRDFELPELMAQILGVEKMDSGELRIEPTTSTRNITTALTAFDSGERVEVSPIELRVTQAGSEEITLSNEHQDVPWRFKLHWQVSGRLKLNTSFEYAGWNVTHGLTMARLHRLLSQGCKISLRDYGTGELLFETDRQSIDIDNREEGWEEFLAALTIIQERSHVALTIPEREISGEEAVAILETAKKIGTGSITAAVTGSVRLELEGDPEDLFSAFDPAATHSLRLGSHETADVLGEAVEMGEAVHTITGARLPGAEVERLRREFESSPGPRAYGVTFELGEESRMTSTYPKWQAV